jgi:two-component system osmolarity sensor histidine kinase EnvZ
VQLREPADTVEAFGAGERGGRIAQLLADQLAADDMGAQTLVAARVNGEPGLWVGFDIGGDGYWLSLPPDSLAQVSRPVWMVWMAFAVLLSLGGAALIARRINRPLTQLSFAASRVRDGDFDASQLDEKVATSEIRQVNIGFNRMATQLAKVEQERAVMLAGISHDLRTPLTRLRLETELSVSDTGARAHMAADIDQLDAIIDKFLDYARPEPPPLKAVAVADVVQTCVYAVNDRSDLRLRTSLTPGLMAMADTVELMRVLDNLIENARRYGKSPDTGVARVDISSRQQGDRVQITVRDHGMGVSQAALARLTEPFFRGDAARTAATGAGLGLAIVEKTISRMGGELKLSNSADGNGLIAHVWLLKAK